MKFDIGNWKYWRKVICVVIILLAIWWCFRPFWESLVECWFIDPLLSVFARGWITTIGFFLLSGLAIWGMFRCRKNGFCFGTQWVGGSIAILIIWLTYRILLGDDTPYVFYSVKKLGWLCYVDIIALLCVCSIGTRLIKPKEMQKEEEGKGFIKDDPIEKWDEDVLSRGGMAKDLVGKLINTKVDNAAFTLGIVASWGEGKTSFMQLMARSLKEEHKDKVIVVNFNPWLYGKGVNLLHVFFDELRRKIAFGYGELSRDLRHYANALSKVDTNWSQVASALKDGFPHRNINEQWEDISEQIKRIQKKIVIFVDDIDRLEGEEMAEVFQLVRNASNFPHMYFVVGYDKKYVVDTLQGIYGGHKLLYTEKILQEEYVLPKLTEQDIVEALKRLLKKVLNEKEREQQVLSQVSLRQLNICKYFKNLRDINRFGNILIGYYTRLEDEVDINDFVRYLILHLRYPLVQSFIEEHQDRVFQYDKYMHSGKVALYHNPHTHQEKVEEIFDSQDHFDLIQYLKQDKCKEEWSLDATDVLLVIRLLEALWGENRSLAIKGINNPQYMHRYFLKNLLGEEIPIKEMEELLQLDFPSMKSKIQEWAESKSASLVTQLSVVPKDKEMVKKYLQVIFYVNEIGAKNEFHFWVIQPMMESLYKPQGGTCNEEDKPFIRDLLLREENPRFAVLYISFVEEEESWRPLDKGELKEIKNVIFQKYATNPRGRLGEICKLWNETWTQTKSADGSTINKYDEGCNQIMRTVADADFENFIPLSIQKDNRNHQLFSLSLPAEVLWDGNEGYFNYAESRKQDTPEWNKYSDFLHRLKANAWNAVSFDFPDEADEII